MAITDDLCRSYLDLREALPLAPDRAHLAALRSIAGAVEELDVEALSDELDRTALLEHVRVQLFRLEHERPWQRNPVLWVETAARGLEDAASEGEALERIAALPDLLAAGVTSLKRPPQLLLDAALAMLDGLAALVERHEAPDAAAIDAHRQAHRAIQLTRTALTSAIGPDGSPHAAAIGEEEVDRRLHHEHASVHNAGELWRAALREAAELEAEVVAHAAAIAPERPWLEVYEAARGRLPRGADRTVALRYAVEAAREFAAAAGLGVPGAAPLEVRAMPGYATVLDPGACWRPGAVLAAWPDPLALPWIAVELGVPGLHLHHAARAGLPGLVRRHVVAASTPLGWALLMVDWMMEQGFAPSPELRLSGRVHLLRAAHLALADLGLHTGQFSAEAAVGHLVTRLPVDAAEAGALVRRIAHRPLEAAAAMFGRRELARLRADATATRGTDYTAAAFHAEVLGYGGLPVPLIRWGMGLDD